MTKENRILIYKLGLSIELENSYAAYKLGVMWLSFHPPPSMPLYLLLGIQSAFSYIYSAHLYNILVKKVKIEAM